ncbi:MAG: hypothetical protein ACRD4B_03985 [Acidobacteriota bacterium]
MTSTDTIRDAVRTDIDTLVAFTLREAYETGGIERNEADLRRGVLEPIAGVASKRHLT